jgi:transposase-like protein
MGRQPKFTDEQKTAIVLDLLSEKMSHAEVCRKYGISSTYAYKLRDRGMDILRDNIGRPAGKPDAEVEQLKRRVEDLEQLAGDQALAIHYLKKTKPRVQR